jgi:HK97 family phage portal protein
MNWLARLNPFGAKEAQSLTSMALPGNGGGGQSLFLGMLKRTRFDYRREVGDGLDSSVVTAPIMWIQRAIPEAELTICRELPDGEEEYLEDHPMLELIKSPNEFYGEIVLWTATALSYLGDGNAYWVIIRDGAGRPAALWWVPHWMMEPMWPADGSVFISHYRYTPGGGRGQVDLPFEDVVHFRNGMNPRNMRKGLSPLDGVIREIFIDLESSNFVASLLRNMGVPGVVISPKAGAIPNSDDVEATKTWFKQAFGGDNRGGPLIMGAPTDVSPYGFNPQQMNMSEGRDVAEERVCACLGIPAAIVGFGAGLQQTKVGATMEELRKLAWNNGVLPILRVFADELQRSLLPQFGDVAGMEVEWDTSDVIALQEDEDKRTERLNKQLDAGAITLFEWRVEMGLPADDSHKFYLRKISVTEVPQGQPPAQTPPAGAAPKEAKAAPSEEGLKKASVWITSIERISTPLAARFTVTLEQYFKRLGAAAKAAALPLLEQEFPKEEKADDLLVAMILDKLGIEQWQRDLSTAYQAQFLEVASAVNGVAEQSGIGTQVPDVVARSILAAGGRRVGLVDLDAQTRDALFQALAEGRAAGEGSTAIAGRIASLVEAGPNNDPQARARRIARTETAYAVNISTIEHAMAAGVTKFVVSDGRYGEPRSLLTHIARHGSIVSAAEALQMAQEEHPNGTLSFAPSFD